MIEKYFPKGKLAILDVGCGTGKNMEELQKFGTVYGLDNTPQAIKYCRERGLKNLKLGTAEKTPFKNCSFDIITLLDVLEHTDDNKTLKEMRRILKKNGIIILTVPAFSWLWSRWDELLHHKRRYNIKHLTNTLRNNHFTTLHAAYLYSFLILPAMLIRTIKQRLFRKKAYPSDFRLSSPLMNKLLGLISEIEFKISENLPVPVGTSITAVAKK